MRSQYEGVPAADQPQLDRRLESIEQDHDVRILYACESGSRAWGFASDDSDFDVRFLYVNRPEWYLSVSLEEQRDVIETPIEEPWDVNGWDLRKALRLFRKSNPPLFEWLQSPIVYRESWSVARHMRELLPVYYSPSASMYHYLHMAQKNYRSYLQSDMVWTKKYFYVLRPLLACRWVESGRGAVPMKFDSLVQSSQLTKDVLRAIDDLLREKRSGGELSEGPKIGVLDDLIVSEFKRFEEAEVTRQPPRPDTEKLSALFRAALTEVWSSV